MKERHVSWELENFKQKWLLQETNQYLHSWADLSFITYGNMLHMPPLLSDKSSSAKIKISSFFDRNLWKITTNAGYYGRLSGYKEIFYTVLVLKKKKLYPLSTLTLFCYSTVFISMPKLFPGVPCSDKWLDFSLLKLSEWPIKSSKEN